MSLITDLVVVHHGGGLALREVQLASRRHLLRRDGGLVPLEGRDLRFVLLRELVGLRELPVLARLCFF